MRVFDKASNDRVYKNVDVLPLYIKVIEEFIVIIDTVQLYVLDKASSKIIATYQAKGDVAHICSRGEGSNIIIGITNSGQLFSINLELKEDCLRPVCEKDRIVSISADMSPRKSVLDQ